MRWMLACVVLVAVGLCDRTEAQTDAPLGQPAPAPSITTADTGRITLELNKLETEPNACRGYFVVDNGRADLLKELQIDVFLFDKQQIVLRRVALTFADVRSGREKVVLFDLADLNCGEVGRLLLNDVLACKNGKGTTIEGCADALTVSTRAEAAFEY